MGCSPSRNEASIVVPQTLKLDHVTVASLTKANPQSTRFIENCLIIWFCDETSNKFEHDREQLRNLVYELKKFNNIDACIAFITDIQDEKVFLIISSTSQSTERFHYLPQIEKIYIFNSSGNVPNEGNYRNLKYDIIGDIDTLYEQLQQDIKLCEMDLIPITSASVSSQEISLSSSLTKQDASFLFGQMLKEITYRLKLESSSKDVFIAFCQAHYGNTNEQLRVVDEFAKNYRPNKALWWLTNQSFISKILNRVQRTREIDISYKLGFFIKQVNIQLQHLQGENASLTEKTPTVYRGKTMSSNEFETLVKNNPRGLLSFDSFFIGTTNREDAVGFVCRRLVLHPDMTSVVFEIHIDHTIINKTSPFASLKGIDMKMDEVCFNMSTVFRIESVQETANDTTVIWLVTLKLVSDDDQQLLRFVTPIRCDELHANPLSFLGKLLMEMGEYRRAEQVFLGLLQDVSVQNQPRRLVRVLNGLGANYTYKKEYVKALEHYQQALQTSLVFLQSDHLDLVPMYKVIGDTYFNQNDCGNAIENYEKAIELLEHHTQQVNWQILTDLHICVNKARQSMESNN